MEESNPLAPSLSFSYSSHYEHPEQQQPPPPPPHVGIPVPSLEVVAQAKDDLCSCLCTLVTFWLFACMMLILGVYGPDDLVLGPHCSRLLQTNSFFVQDIKVKIIGESEQGVMLYGFRKPPPLDVQTAWSETYNASIPANFHKEWIYYLNEQAQINVSCTVLSNASQPLILVIAQGTKSLTVWIENPSLPSIPLSWKLILGNGSSQHGIAKTSDYYVAIGNLNQQEIEVKLNIRIQNILHNTTAAHYKCSLGHNSCHMKLAFLRENAAIVTTSGPKQDIMEQELYVKVSYGPRWITYIVGSGALSIATLLLFKTFTYLLIRRGYVASQLYADAMTGREALLSNKDDDTMSLGSSYDSVPNNGEDFEEQLDAMPNEGEDDKARHICMICCNSQRDSFFLPCGHCVTCFTCGTRIADEVGICPICRRKMKKVRKIFTV